MAFRSHWVRGGSRSARKSSRRIRAGGGEAIALPLDVIDSDSVQGFVHQATEQLGDIEVLVTGAGDTYFSRLHEIDTETFESQIQISNT